MSFLLWIVCGFMGGVITSQNSRQMSTPVLGSIVLAFLVGCGITFFAGYRGKSVAVATAVANATAIAKAEANANAKAIANSAINLYLGQQAGITPEIVGTIVNQSLEQNSQHALSHDTFGEKEMV